MAGIQWEGCWKWIRNGAAVLHVNLDGNDDDNGDNNADDDDNDDNDDDDDDNGDNDDDDDDNGDNDDDRL